MRRFIFIVLITCFADLDSAVSNTKDIRGAQGLVFTSNYESKELCISLGCATGKGYLGSQKGDYYSVKRCNKCATTQYLSTAILYCSVIPSIDSELSIFQGFLKSLTVLNEGSVESGINDETEIKESSDVDETEDIEDDDISEVSEVTKSRNNKGVSIEEGLTSASLLQLFSQVSELSEIEDADLDDNEKKKRLTNNGNGKGIKYLFSRIFGRKSKKNDSSNDFSKTHNNVKEGLTLKKLFKIGKKSKNINKKFKEDASNDLNQRIIRREELIEYKFDGNEFDERTTLCSVSNGFVQVTVHVFFQFYNIKKRFHLKSSKYSAFELVVDTKCKEEKTCTKPSRFIGRLTPRQKLVMSNSLSVSAGTLKNEIRRILNSARVYYRCKSPKCFPMQYNSCVKITCAINNESQDQKLLEIQSKDFETNERKLNESITNEIKTFRDEINRLNREQEEIGRTDISKKMNGPLSIVDDLDTINAQASVFTKNKGITNNETDRVDTEDDSVEEETKSSVEREVIQDSVVNAPTEKTISKGLDERLKRSLETPLEEEEEIMSKEPTEGITETEGQEFVEVPIQQSIPINYETDKMGMENKDGKKIVYITMGIVLLITIIGGIIYVT